LLTSFRGAPPDWRRRRGKYKPGRGLPIPTLFAGRRHDVTPSRGEQIAMTAPVVQSAATETGWVIRFFMPAKWTMETLPAPSDDQVRLVTVPPSTVAVLRFSGDRSPKAVASRIANLLKTLQDNGIQPTGDAEAWFYDPPWTLPMRRRNEIAIPIDPACALH